MSADSCSVKDTGISNTEMPDFHLKMLELFYVLHISLVLGQIGLCLRN